MAGLYGGYFSGNSRRCAPVPSTQNTPFRTARVSCHGRPRLSSRRRGRSTGSITAHCSSVNSQRPVTALRGYPRAAPGSHEIGRQLFMRLVLAILTLPYAHETDQRRLVAHTVPGIFRNTKKSLHHIGVELTSGATDDFVPCVLE
jgi:hypothetical protein